MMLFPGSIDNQTTNSLSTLQTLSSNLSRSKTIMQCHKALDELAKHNTVHIKCVAAHVIHCATRKGTNWQKLEQLARVL